MQAYTVIVNVADRLLSTSVPEDRGKNASQAQEGASVAAILGAYRRARFLIIRTVLASSSS